MKLLRSERGTTVTEFALLLPALFLFLLVIMEGGRVLATWITLTHVTRETTRWIIAGGQEYAAQKNCPSSSSTSEVDWNCVDTTLVQEATAYEQRLMGTASSSGNSPAACPFGPGYWLGTTSSLSVCVDPEPWNQGLPVSSVQVTATYTLNTLTPILQNVVKTFNAYTTATMRAES